MSKPILVITYPNSDCLKASIEMLDYTRDTITDYHILGITEDMKIEILNGNDFEIEKPFDIPNNPFDDKQTKYIFDNAIKIREQNLKTLDIIKKNIKDYVLTGCIVENNIDGVQKIDMSFFNQNNIVATKYNILFCENEYNELLKDISNKTISKLDQTKNNESIKSGLSTGFRNMLRTRKRF
jgi:hypothetical protein